MRNIVYLNGEFLPYEKAHIPLATHALHYGTGCFEGVRAYYNNGLIVFRLLDHFERLKRSAKTLHMKLPDINFFQVTINLLKKNKYREGVYIRPLVYKSSETVTKFNLDQLEDGFAIYTTPLGHHLDVNNGVIVKFSSWKRVSSDAIPVSAKPTGLYLNTCLAKTEIDNEGFGEAVFLNSDGSIAEGSAENIFLVKNKKLITPSLDQNILEGITRNTIIQLAKNEFGMETIERKVMSDELITADEVFLTGTGAEVTPVNSVGPITKNLQQLYFDVVHGKVKKYSHWLTYAR